MGDSDDYDIAGFLQRDGAIGLLTRLDTKEGKLVGEIEAEVHVSHTTFQERKDEALNLDLIERVLSPDDHGNAKRYQLTRRGKTVLTEMKRKGVTDDYREFFDCYELLEEGKDELADWVQDEQITDPDWPYDPEPAHDYYED